MRRVLIGINTFALVFAMHGSALASTYYIGSFAGSTPQDDSQCGLGKGSAPNPHPCATLAYWTANRRSILDDGDTVRMTGTLASCGPVSCSNLCIVADDPGVTYEGRNANDTDADNKAGVIIDGAANTTGDSAGPCNGELVAGYRTDFDRMVFRDMTLRNGQRNSSSYGAIRFWPPSGGCSGPSNSCDGLTLDKVRVTGSVRMGGAQIGKSVSNEDNPCNGNYDTTNVTITGSEFDNNRGHGMVLSCVDGFTIAETEFHDNYNVGCNPAIHGPGDPECNVHGACDNSDGILIGSKNGTVTDSASYNNGEDNWDIGAPTAGDCEAASNNITFDRILSYNPTCNASFSQSHCAHDITLQNSFLWGRGALFDQKSCAHSLKVYNNTFWGERGIVIKLWDNCRGCDFRNNIIRVDDSGSGTIYPVFVDYNSSNDETTWLNNLIFNSGTNTNIKFGSFLGAGSDTRCPVNDPQSPGFAESPGGQESSIQITSSNASSFASSCAAGNWFGNSIAGNCGTDLWATAPGVVDGNNPSAANLHLAAGAASDAGACIAPSFADYDGDQRPTCPSSGWAIGADQIGSAVLTTPRLLSVTPLP